MSDKSFHELTIGRLFEQCKEWNAGLMTIVSRDEHDIPIRAVIVIDDPDGLDEILAAIEKIEGDWEREREFANHQAERGEPPDDRYDDRGGD